MSFLTNCPACHRELDVPNAKSGKTGPCPGCGTRIRLQPFESVVVTDSPRLRVKPAPQPEEQPAAVAMAFDQWRHRAGGVMSLETVWIVLGKVWAAFIDVLDVFFTWMHKPRKQKERQPFGNWLFSGISQLIEMAGGLIAIYAVINFCYLFFSRTLPEDNRDAAEELVLRVMAHVAMLVVGFLIGAAGRGLGKLWK